MKIGLLIGINYRGQDNELSGCISDVVAMREVLEKEFDYDDIVMLTEDEIEPTRMNIMKGFNGLVEKINGGCNEVWVHYSGHGYKLHDMDGDEEDGFDEIIIPLDYKDNGIISDDLLNEYFLSKITNPDVKIFIFMDCCHSGTIMDLMYHYKGNEWVKVNNKDCLGHVVCMSGCCDNQESAESYNICNNKRWSGAMTTIFLDIVKTQKYNISLKNLLKTLRKRLKAIGMVQIPQLTANYEIDIDVNIF